MVLVVPVVSVPPSQDQAKVSVLVECANAAPANAARVPVTLVTLVHDSPPRVRSTVAWAAQVPVNAHVVGGAWSTRTSKLSPGSTSKPVGSVCPRGRRHLTA